MMIIKFVFLNLQSIRKESKEERFEILSQIVRYQLNILNNLEQSKIYRTNKVVSIV